MPSFRDAAKPAGPESITTVSEYGFRARRFAAPRNDYNLNVSYVAG